ncbi:MAG: PIN domain-containing protein [Rhodobacteraceae bacterium]|nr:PIN domain-containing protein [Paracoccaceae bacterium]
MKGLFPQFDPVRDRDFQKIWSDAVFVFDTNVWLNLYRYQSDTRDQLLAVIERIKDRVWMPYYVAVEFQRNRIKVMASQGNKFSEVRSAVVKFQSKFKADLEELKIDRRHALIDTSALLTGIDRLISEYVEDLDGLERKQSKLNDSDPLKVRIEDCLSGKVGAPPVDQKSLEAIYDKAKVRFEKRIPPGYMDKDKDRGDADDFMHNGLFYKRRYGDYLIWQQMLDHAKAQNLKRLIFVTDDAKEDWWWKESLGGPKTLGPRPELVEEAQLLGGIEDFLMYPPDRFLEFSKEFLRAKISDGALEDVRDVSTARSLAPNSGRSLMRSRKAVFNWLVSEFSYVEYLGLGVVQFLARSEKHKFGFSVNEAAVSQMGIARAFPKLREAAEYVDASDLDMLTLVWVARSNSGVFDMLAQIKRLPSFLNTKRIKHVVGILAERPDGEDVFLPVAEWSHGGEVAYRIGDSSWGLDGGALPEG